jgi:hypothetical protein
MPRADTKGLSDLTAEVGLSPSPLGEQLSARYVIQRSNERIQA